MKPRWIATMVALVAVVGFVSIAEACPGCKEALASDGGPQGNIVKGYFWSILFMMSMPFALIGAFGSYMYLEVKRARKRDAEESSNE